MDAGPCSARRVDIDLKMKALPGMLQLETLINGRQVCEADLMWGSVQDGKSKSGATMPLCALEVA